MARFTITCTQVNVQEDESADKVKRATIVIVSIGRDHQHMQNELRL